MLLRILIETYGWQSSPAAVAAEAGEYASLREAGALFFHIHNVVMPSQTSTGLGLTSWRFSTCLRGHR
jgi:hypothetical protein